MLIDHVDLTVPPGTLTPAFETDLDKLLEGILGWTGEHRVFPSPLDGVVRVERAYHLPNGQFVILREALDYLHIGFEDHIGVQLEPPEFERVYTACRELAAADRRVELAWIVDGLPLRAQLGAVTLRGVFVRYLLPIWLDIQTREHSTT